MVWNNEFTLRLSFRLVWNLSLRIQKPNKIPDKPE